MPESIKEKLDESLKVFKRNIGSIRERLDECLEVLGKD